MVIPGSLSLFNFLLCWHLSNSAFYLLFLIVVFVTFLHAEEKSAGWFGARCLPFSDGPQAPAHCTAESLCACTVTFPLHPAQRHGSSQCECSYTYLGRWKYVMTGTPFALCWLLHCLMSVFEDAFPVRRHRKGAGTKHQLLQCTFLCFCTTEPSVSVSSAMLGFVWQCLSHGQYSLWVTMLWEKYVPEGYGRQVRDPTCSVCTPSKVIRKNQALPAIWSETAYVLMTEWGQILFPRVCKGLFLIQH